MDIEKNKRTWYLAFKQVYFQHLPYASINMRNKKGINNESIFTLYGITKFNF